MTTVAQQARPVTREPAWWGMVMLIATEGTLFALLIGSYFYTESRATGAWPPLAAEQGSLRIPVVMTILIATSSVPAYLAERSIRRGRQGRLQLYLVVTIALGAAFLALQADEYAHKSDLFTPRTDAYGSLFYTITGLHGAHVVVGLGLLAWTLGIAVRGGFGAARHLAVQNVSLYWHFVHVVWLLVFTSLYLLPAL